MPEPNSNPSGQLEHSLRSPPQLLRQSVQHDVPPSSSRLTEAERNAMAQQVARAVFTTIAAASSTSTSTETWEWATAGAEFWGVAVEQGVFGWLANTAKAAGVALPTAVEHARMAAVGREWQMANVARRALAALHRHHIPAVPLKGLALISEVYPLGGWRDISDWDILVPFPVQPAVRALQSAGFRHRSADPLINAFHMSRDGLHAVMTTIDDTPPPTSSANRTFITAPPSIRPLRQRVVELHHHLYLDWPEGVAAEILARCAANSLTAVCPLTGERVWQAELVDQFLIVCHHLLLNRNRLLKWWLDVDRLARRLFTAIDQSTASGTADAAIDAVLDRAERWGDPLTPMIALGGAAEWFSTPIPRRLWAGLCRLLRQHEREVIRHAAVITTTTSTPTTGYRAIDKVAWLRALALDHGAGRRHRTFRRLVFPHPGEIADMLGCTTTQRRFFWRRLAFTASRLAQIVAFGRRRPRHHGH